MSLLIAVLAVGYLGRDLLVPLLRYVAADVAEGALEIGPKGWVAVLLGLPAMWVFLVMAAL